MAMILFKNGVQIQVPQGVLDALHERVLSDKGAKPWQGMTNEKDEVVYLINMDEIMFITRYDEDFKTTK